MDLFDINSLFPQLVLALGAALVGGNGLALWHHRQGKRPDDLGELRVGRARWLVVVGAILVQLCLGAIYAWSVFTPALKEAGWTPV